MLNIVGSTSQYQKSKTFCLSQASTLREICAPLFQLLGIHGFTCQRMYRNGERLYLSSSEAWIENFYKNQYFMASGFEKFSALPPFTLWKYWPTEDEDFYRLMADAKENFNYGNGLVVNRLQKDYVDAFTLRGFPQDDRLNNRYLNEYSSINKFFDYFYVVASPLLEEARKFSVFVQEENSDIIFNQNDLTKVGDKEAFNNLLNKKIICFNNGKEVSFTKREIDCIYFLVRGKTMKEIAKILNLSSRTVEYYIVSIKLKLNCHSKSKAVEKIMSQKWNQNVLFEH